MRTIAVTLSITRATDKAVMAELAGPDSTIRELWIPRSQIDDGDEVEVGLNQDLEIAQWLVEKEGLDA